MTIKLRITETGRAGLVGLARHLALRDGWSAERIDAMLRRMERADYHDAARVLRDSFGRLATVDGNVRDISGNLCHDD